MMEREEIRNPFIQYMYSYPHKTAYGSLQGIVLQKYMSFLAGRQNSLYVHIPFCQYKCGYCNLFSAAGQPEELIEQYVDALERQAEQWAELVPEKAVFHELVLGGGTPLILPERLLRRIFGIAGQYFGFQKGNPVIVETSPNQTTREKLSLLKEEGVTRLSIGVQSFQWEELETLHRFHKAETVCSVLEAIKETGFDCLNLDLIYGIPGQTAESLEDSLLQALSYQPEELFVYPLYVKPGTCLYQQGMKRAQNVVLLQRYARKRLTEAGYQAYSMRRFVKEDGEPQVSLCGFGNTLALGCGGRSYLGNLHFCTPYAVKQEQCIRILGEYIKKKDYREITHGFLLSEEEQKRRYLIKHILFGKGVNREDYRKHFKENPEEAFGKLRDWIEQGYAVTTGDYITLTEEGILLSDYLGPQLMSDAVRLKMKEA